MFANVVRDQPQAFHDSTFRNDGVRHVLNTVPKLDMVMQELRLGAARGLLG
jgi:hypothetical protein